ncbi:hypothetical protein [Peterkaempfera griseoplana]|uniref:hypothetical protein n=1 Tax=Peterkaempfera griseoplana TaxID=66896 RepID=UPI0006E31285|nr:hypothetical protein [Peterkaempfera griseoplana]
MRQTKFNHAPVAAECRANPGEWHRTRAYPSSHTAKTTADHVRAGRLPSYTPAGAYDGTVRTEDGEPVLYVRYVGASGGEGR